MKKKNYLRIKVQACKINRNIVNICALSLIINHPFDLLEINIKLKETNMNVNGCRKTEKKSTTLGPSSCIWIGI